jgi:hypothetical protein
MTQRKLTRRTLLGTSLMTGAALATPQLALAESNGCEVLRIIEGRARNDHDDPDLWALTLDPFAIVRLLSEIDALQAHLDTLTGTVEGQRREQLLAYLDLVGGGILLITGFFVATPTALTAGIVFGTTMLLVQGVASPQHARPKAIYDNIATNRIPLYAELFGESAAIVSTRAANYGQIAGRIAGGAVVIYNAYGFVQTTNAFQASTPELQRLRDNMAGKRAAVAELQNQIKLQEFRRHCAAGTLEDLATLSPYCPINGTLP